MRRTPALPRELIAEFKRADVPFSIAGRRIVDVFKLYIKREPRDLSAAVRFYCERDHEGDHGAAADVLATKDILDAQVQRYGDLPRTIAALHDHLRDPEPLDFEGKFKRRPDGFVVLAFSRHEGRPIDDMARNDPGFLHWMLGKDFLDDAKAIAREALERANPIDLR